MKQNPRLERRENAGKTITVAYALSEQPLLDAEATYRTE
jgi:hypothetical protein